MNLQNMTETPINVQYFRLCEWHKKIIRFTNMYVRIFSRKTLFIKHVTNNYLHSKNLQNHHLVELSLNNMSIQCLNIFSINFKEKNNKISIYRFFFLLISRLPSMRDEKHDLYYYNYSAQNLICIGNDLSWHRVGI